MRIFLDADACPVVLRDILLRAVDRTQYSLLIVANHPIYLPHRPWMQRIQVDAGPDAADHYIAEHILPGELTITADIPLSARVIAKGAFVLNFHGERLDAECIGDRLATRNLMHELRSAGIASSHNSGPGSRERQRFAAQLDRFIQQNRSVSG